MRVLLGPLTPGGEATASLPDGRLALVRGGCPGDVADIDIVQPSGPHPHARILSLREPSADRVDAPCPYFGECSGCQWQHVSASAQLEAKSRFVAEAFASVPGYEPPLLPVVPSPEPYGYRNALTFTTDEPLRATGIGIASADGHSLIAVERCLLLPEPFQDAPRRLAGALRFLSGRHGPLGVRRVSIRVSRATRDVEVGLWTDPGPFPRQLAGKAFADAIGASSVVRVLIKNDGPVEKTTGIEILTGRGWWSESVSRRTFIVSAPSPFPPNASAAVRLVDSVIAGLKPKASESALDAHAGVGLVSAALSERCASVVACDASRFSLADLRRNLTRNEHNVEVVGGDPARELLSLGRFDLLVASPPATGLTHESIAALAGTRARVVVAVE